MRRTPELAAFGAALRQLRQDAGLSQEALAHRSGLHRNYIGGIERGERNIGLENVFRLAGALDTQPSRLLVLVEARLQTGADGRAPGD